MLFWVEDATKAWQETTQRGAKSYMEPKVEEDEHGRVVRSGIYTYGETVHIFVERKDYKGVFLPGYKKWESHYNPASRIKNSLTMVGNVDWNEMNKWCEFYAKVMGLLKSSPLMTTIYLLIIRP